MMMMTTGIHMVDMTAVQRRLWGVAQEAGEVGVVFRRMMKKQRKRTGHSTLPFKVRQSTYGMHIST
jgi:hypothetical protein